MTYGPFDQSAERSDEGGREVPTGADSGPQRVPAQEAKITVDGLNVYYGTTHALKNISLTIPGRHVTALMGPSGCGKSTFLRALNRMHDLTPNARVTGAIMLDGQNVLDESVDVVRLRQRVGMVFQRPNPFPKSIFENVAYGLHVQGGHGRSEIQDGVERSLHAAALWDEVKDRLKRSALSLSGGQQQRLCIARALAVEPEIILMDEPCSALDPLATLKIEQLIDQLKHSIPSLSSRITSSRRHVSRSIRASSCWATLIEFGTTSQIFAQPRDRRTEDFITGRFG